MCTVGRCLRENGVGTFVQGDLRAKRTKDIGKTNGDDNYAVTLDQLLPVYVGDQHKVGQVNIVRFAINNLLYSLRSCICAEVLVPSSKHHPHVRNL